jgi:hypothetical protein
MKWEFEMNTRKPLERIKRQNDENRNTKWDWLPNALYTLYTTGGEHYQVRLPYYSDTSPVRQSLGQRDVMPDGGWVLLDRDFGTTEEGTELPRFILYNRFSGTIRFFFFNYKIANPFSAAFVRLHLVNTGSGTTLPSLLTFYAGDIRSYQGDCHEPYTNAEEYLGGYDQNREVVAVTKLAYREWCYADFYLVGFDPELASAKYCDSAFAFEVVGVNEFELTAGGAVSLSPMYDRGTSNVLTDFSSLVSKIPTGQIVNFVKSFGNSTDANKADQQRAEAAGDQQLKQQLISMATAVVGSYLPALGVVAGFLGGVIGGGRSPQLVEYQGGLSIKGSLSQAAPVLFCYLRVPGARHSGDDAMPLWNGIPGIFNLRNRPDSRVVRTEDICHPGYEPGSEECDTDFYCSLNPIDCVINNAIQDATITVEAAICEIGGKGRRYRLIPPGFVSIARLPTIEYSYRLFDSPYMQPGFQADRQFGFVIHIIVGSTSPAADFSPVHIYKTYVPLNGS